MTMLCYFALIISLCTLPGSSLYTRKLHAANDATLFPAYVDLIRRSLCSTVLTVRFSSILLRPVNKTSWTKSSFQIFVPSYSYIVRLSIGLLLVLLCQNLQYRLFTAVSIMLLSNDIETNPGPNSDFAKLVHLNVWSIRNKIDQLAAEIPDDCKVLCITETKIDANIKDEKITIPGFSSPILRKDKCNMSGGICIQVKEPVVARRLTQYENNDLELLWAHITIENNWFILGVIYRNPILPVSYWDSLQDNLLNVVETYGSRNIVLVGDLNEDLLNPNNHHLKDVIDSLSMTQLLDGPTRTTPHSSTLIDPIIPNIAISHGILPPFCSDHCPVFVNLSFKLPTRTTYKRKIFKYRQADWNLMNNTLTEIDWPNLLNDTVNIDDATSLFQDKLDTVIKRHVQSATIRFSNRDKCWINADIKLGIKKRNKLYRKAKRSNSDQDWTLFKRQRNHVTLSIRKAKETHITRLADKLETSENNSKLWWKLAKAVLNPDYVQKSIPSLVDDNNIHYSDPTAKANLLNNYFASICTVNDDHVPLDPESILDIPPLEIFQFNQQDVYKELQALDTNKAMGPDEISPIVLKNLAGALALPIFLICLKSKSTCKYPFTCKNANVTPLFKKGDPHKPNNYRPISLLSILGKIREKIIYKNLFNHVKAHISPSQSGFLPGHSTVTQLLEIYHKILSSLDEKKETLLCFFDISKAFDRVSHRAIINKLKHFNVKGDALKWFADYLDNRFQRVIIDGKYSEWKRIFAGVPQGSILGPLLFLIFINDIVTDIDVLIRLFADDTSLNLSSSELLQSHILMQNDINTISEWALKWSVTFNLDKNTFLLISRRQSPTQLSLTFNGQSINQSNKHKHLGVTFNSQGNWSHHMEEVITKANKRLGILLNLKYVLSRNALKTLYISNVRSIIEYSDILWDCIPDYLLKRLERINLNAIRCITGLTISTHTPKLYTESGLQPLYIRRKIHRLTQMYKIVHGLAPTYLTELLPERTADRNPYPVRNTDVYTPYKCRTESLNNSFFPQTIRDWNKLPPNIQNAPSVASFKSQVKNIPDLKPPNPPKWFNVGQRKLNIFHSQIRNNCSPLNNDLFTNHIPQDPHCYFCPNKIENDNHYFLVCPKYELHRTALRNEFQNMNTQLNLENILRGNMSLNYDDNSNIFLAVQTFIKDTKRFD